MCLSLFTTSLFCFPQLLCTQAAAIGAPAWPKNVAAWLMMNSMRMEGLQFLQLNKQELENTWRKKALATLVDDYRTGMGELQNNYAQAGMRLEQAVIGQLRMKRFMEEASVLGAPLTEEGMPSAFGPIATAVDQFREEINFDIASGVPQAHAYAPQPYAYAPPLVNTKCYPAPIW